VVTEPALLAVVLLLLEQSGHWSLHVSNKELEQTESSSSTHFVRAHTPRCYAQKPSSTAQPAAGAPSFASPVPERMPYSTGVGRETFRKQRWRRETTCLSSTSLSSNCSSRCNSRYSSRRGRIYNSVISNPKTPRFNSISSSTWSTKQGKT